MRTYRLTIKSTIPNEVLFEQDYETLAEAMFGAWTRTRRFNDKMYNIDNLEWTIKRYEEKDSTTFRTMANGWYVDGMLPVVRTWDDDKD